MSIPATSLDPFGINGGDKKSRAQALRLVRYLFGRDVDPALATAIAHWVITGQFSQVTRWPAVDAASDRP